MSDKRIRADKKVRVRLIEVESCEECDSRIFSEGHGAQVCFDKTLKTARSGKKFRPSDFVLKDPHHIPKWCPLELMSGQALYLHEYGPDKRKKG